MLTRLRLEQPKALAITDVFTLLQGWYLADHADDTLEITAAGVPLAVSTLHRPDVARAHPQLHSAGFEALLDLRTLPGSEAAVPVEVRGGGECLRETLTVEPQARRSATEWDRRKATKLERLRPLLQCAVCRVPGTLVEGDGALECRGCGRAYPATGSHFDMLTEDLRDRFAVVETDNVSRNRYEAYSSEAIDHGRATGGLVLDFGAGFRSSVDPDIVCLEIVPYPSTDVLGVGQCLPFEDGAFSAVVAKAVLEHVTDPFACAAEIVRVTAPGGRIYCSVPFLEPEHGYPNHYYNMTQAGLANLFATQDTRILRQSIPPWCHPASSLAWMLNGYLAHLPEAEARRFRSMTVAEVIALRTKYDDPVVAMLDDEGQRKLAAATAILLERR